MDSDDIRVRAPTTRLDKDWSRWTDTGRVLLCDNQGRKGPLSLNGVFVRRGTSVVLRKENGGGFGHMVQGRGTSVTVSCDTRRRVDGEGCNVVQGRDSEQMYGGFVPRLDG